MPDKCKVVPLTARHKHAGCKSCQAADLNLASNKASFSAVPTRILLETPPTFVKSPLFRRLLKMKTKQVVHSWAEENGSIGGWFVTSRSLQSVASKTAIAQSQ